MDNLNIPKLPYNGDVNEAQRQGDRAAIRTIMAWRKRRELGESEPEESVKDAEPSLTKASDQSTSLDANSTPSHLEPIRGQSSSAAQSTPTTADAARTSINSPGATPEVSLAQAPTIDTYNGNNSDSDDGPPPLEACSDTSSDEEPHQRHTKSAAFQPRGRSNGGGRNANQDLTLGKGSRVQFHGLVSKPEMNGMVGVVAGNMNRNTNRWPVTIDGGRLFNIKASNLQVLSNTNSSLPNTEIKGGSNNAKKQKTAKSLVVGAAASDGSDSEEMPPLESCSDSESDSDKRAAPPLKKHQTSTKSATKKSVGQKKSVSSSAATPKVTRSGNNSDSDDGPPPLESYYDSSSDEEPPQRHAKSAASEAPSRGGSNSGGSGSQNANQDLSLGKGSRVQFHGLVSKPEMNGMVGVVAGNMNRNTNRWPVTIDGGRLFNIKASNLQVLSNTNSSLPNTEIKGASNNAKKQKTAKSSAAGAAASDGSDSEEMPPLESCSDSESDSDKRAAPPLKKHQTSTKSATKESVEQKKSKEELPTTRAAAADSESDAGPPPGDHNLPRQSDQSTGNAKRGLNTSATSKEISPAANTPTPAQQLKASERAAAHNLYKSKLSNYRNGMETNQQQHGLRYGVGEKVRVLVITEPGKPAAWQPAVVTGVRARANSAWPVWKTVPYLVALEHGTEDDATQWVATDTDRWVQSLKLIELVELRHKLIRSHGVANPEPIPGSAAITSA